MRKYLIILIVGLVSTNTFAQTPFIGSISSTTGKAGDVINITGRGFSETSSELQVRFGGAVAEIVSSTTNLIEVKVPNNAGFNNVYVTNLISGLTVSSKDQFLYSYNGESFEISKFAAQQQFTTGESGISDICLCDFNNDSTLDVGVTNFVAQANQDGTFNIFTNNSTADNLVLNRTDIEVAETRYTVCGDLNGDGKAEIIVTENDLIDIFIFENISTGASIEFDIANPTVLSLPRKANDVLRVVYEIELKDLDNNGKLDLIATNSIDSLIDIFENTSTSGNISFESTPIQVELPDLEESGGIDVQDLNNDGFEEIIISSLQEPNAFIIVNESNEGSIGFGEVITLEFGARANDVASGDFNNDGFKDIAVINRDNDVGIFVNETTTEGGNISFSTANTINTLNDNSWSLGLGDINGDGNVDIITTSLATTSSQLSVFINNTTGGSLDFDDAIGISTVRNARTLEIADMDGDSRPDLVFPHNIGANNAGDLSVILNNNCIRPEISPNTGSTICSNVSFPIEAPFAPGTTYLWELDLGSGFDTIQFDTNNTIDAQDHLDPGQTGDFRVRLISDGGSCSLASSTITVVVDAATATTPSPTSSGSACIGDNVQLFANVSAPIYLWSGPNGFSSTDENPIITDFQLENAGRYELIVNSASCSSEPGAVVVDLRAFPFIQIDDEDQPTFCNGFTKTLTVPDYDGYTYRWELDGTPIANSNVTSLPITAGGTYTAVLIDATSCESESSPVIIETINPPLSSFNGDSKKCVDLAIDFEATSTTSDNRFTVSNLWDFGDGSPTEQTDNFSKTYSTAGTYNVVLTASYTEIPDCFDTETVAVEIRNIPDYDIGADATEKCPSDSIQLTLPADFMSYDWSTGDTGSSTYAVTENGETSVDVSVDWTDDAGCVGSSDITISNFANSALEITSEGPTIINDTISIGENEKSVILSVSGGTDYQWEPALVIENATTNRVTVFPSTRTTVVSVTGTTANDCVETESVTILNDNIVPRKTFSPNGDGMGFDCWEILNAPTTCEVFIFDSKGTVIRQVTPDGTSNCVWDGTANGANVPDGVYYFVMKCTDSEINRTGSILLAR